MSNHDMLLPERDIDRIIQALGAIRLIRDHYASGEESQRLMQEVLTMLRGGGLTCKNIAVAIDCANRMKGVQEAPLSAVSKAA